LDERRAGVVKTMEKASMGEVAKKLTEIWQKLEPDVKKQFEDKASSLKATYDKELAEYKNSASYKSYQKAVSKITGPKAKKAVAKAKARAKKAAVKAKAKAKAAVKAKAKAAVKAKAAAGSDSDVMGSDSDSDSSNSDSD